MPNPRKIRFGVAVNFPDDVQQWRDTARKVEDLGYDVLLVADHLTRQWAPLLALLTAAEATSRIHVGTQVIANDFRLPIVLAREVATLDVLTGGRFELGIGVGHPASSPTGQNDYRQLGVEMDEPGPRVTRLDESLRLIKAYLESDEPFDFDGKFFNTKAAAPYPRPVTKPRPRIMVAGAGPRMLRLAAREADIINIAPRPPTVGVTSRGSTGFGLDIHDELAIIREAAGPRYDDLELCVFADRTAVTADPSAEVEKLAGEFGISIEKLHEMPHTLIGEPGAIAGAILEHRDKYDISYRIVPAYAMEAYAPVIKRVGGK